MIISHSHKFIFLKTRKTAGTSIEIALSGLCDAGDVLTPISPKDERSRQQAGRMTAQNYWFDGEKLGRHSTAADTIRLLGREVWDSYLTFTFERNPSDKAISLYYWRTRNEAKPPSITQFLEQSDERSLSNWSIYADEHLVLADRVFPYESLDAGLVDAQALIARISKQDITDVFVDLPRAKAGHRPDYSNHRDVLDSEARLTIERHCYRELSYFGYEW